MRFTLGLAALLSVAICDVAGSQAAAQSYGRLPLSSIENQGQADPRIAFYVQSPGRSLYFTRDGHTLRLTRGKGDDAKAHTIKVDLVEAAAERIESLERAPGIVSYFKGTKDQWKTAIPTHARIGYVQPWPGIDLAYDGTGGRLESIYSVAPRADPAQIKLRYAGQDSLRLDAQGNLVVTTSPRRDHGDRQAGFRGGPCSDSRKGVAGLVLAQSLEKPISLTRR
jgi:hypothetical protein